MTNFIKSNFLRFVGVSFASPFHLVSWWIWALAIGTNILSSPYVLTCFFIMPDSQACYATSYFWLYGWTFIHLLYGFLSAFMLRLFVEENLFKVIGIIEIMLLVVIRPIWDKFKFFCWLHLMPDLFLINSELFKHYNFEKYKNVKSNPSLAARFSDYYVSKSFLARLRKGYVRASLRGFHTAQSKPNTPLVPMASDSQKLNPNYVTGFIDGEGSFSLGLIVSNKYKFGIQVQLIFKINLHNKDLALLKQIQSYFGVGKISKHGAESIQFQVKSIKDLQVIIDHFDKYPLITQKLADYLLFKQAFELVKGKEHLTPEGLQKIVNIKASMNNGLSDELKATFPKTKPVSRPEVVDQVIQDPNWLAGFASGEACFYISVAARSSDFNSGLQVQLKFIITQHSRDAKLMEGLTEYFGCGGYYPSSNKEAGDFIVTRLSDITDKIIPFFEKYPVEGVKALDFADFRKASELIKAKAHLTSSGLEQIRRLKAGMNTGREVK